MILHSVMVTYDRLYATKLSIASYLETVTVPYTLVVVDNGSTDGTLEWLEEQWVAGGVIDDYIELGENKYPGYACNRGWEYAPDDAQVLHRADNDWAYCVTPDTLILGADYAWHQAGDLVSGDMLVAFDEHVPGIKGEQKGKQRTLQPSLVRSAQTIVAASSRVITDCSPDTVASEDHLWLARDAEGPAYLGRTPRWKATRDLVPGDRILRFGEPWGGASSEISAAYTAGLFDGEGCLSGGWMSFAQKPGVVLDRGVNELSALGFTTVVENYGNGSAARIRISGGIPEVMRFLHQVPTTRFGHDYFWQGRQIVRKNGGPPHYATVMAVENVGEREVVALGTSTATIITNGLYSHNCPGWCEQVERAFRDPKVGQVGLRTQREEPVSYNVGGNNVIRRTLWDNGLRYDERPWTELPAGHSEDTYLSPAVEQMGYKWTRVRQPCIYGVSVESKDDQYYIDSYTARRIYGFGR